MASFATFCWAASGGKGEAGATDMMKRRENKERTATFIEA